MRLVVVNWTLLYVQGRHREQPLAECRIFPNLEVPCLRGKALGSSAEHIFPFCVFPFVYLL